MFIVQKDKFVSILSLEDSALGNRSIFQLFVFINLEQYSHTFVAVFSIFELSLLTFSFEFDDDSLVPSIGIINLPLT